MLSFLKPNKANIVGTISLLVANVIAGSISRIAISLYLGSTADLGGRTGYGGGFAGDAGATSGMMRNGNFGLLSVAVNYILLALFFYAIVSFVVVKLAETQDNPKGPMNKAQPKGE